MTTYYCIKETKEIIGTHKDWLLLRDTNPERFKSLNKYPSPIELVRTGGFQRSSIDMIKEYGLYDKHVKECKEEMRRSIKEAELQRESLLKGIEVVDSGYAGGVLLDKLEELEEYIEYGKRELKDPSCLRLTKDDG